MTILVSGVLRRLGRCLVMEEPRYALIVRVDSKRPDYCLICDIEEELANGAIVICREDEECMPMRAVDPSQRNVNRAGDPGDED